MMRGPLNGGRSEAARQWNGEEPLVDLVAEAYWYERQLTDAEIAEIELATGIETADDAHSRLRLDSYGLTPR
jgi:hypothetical protein